MISQMTSPRWSCGLSMMVTATIRQRRHAASSAASRRHAKPAHYADAGLLKVLLFRRQCRLFLGYRMGFMSIYSSGLYAMRFAYIYLLGFKMAFIAASITCASLAASKMAPSPRLQARAFDEVFTDCHICATPFDADAMHEWALMRRLAQDIHARLQHAATRSHENGLRERPIK